LRKVVGEAAVALEAAVVPEEHLQAAPRRAAQQAAAQRQAHRVDRRLVQEVQ
jgi:hypothetical protein